MNELFWLGCFSAALVLFVGLALIGAVVYVGLQLSELPEAVRTEMGEGDAAELKRAIRALEGRIDDAVGYGERLVKRADMAARRSKGGAEQPAEVVETTLTKLAALRAKARASGKLRS